jgi:hypothetical protein
MREKLFSFSLPEHEKKKLETLAGAANVSMARYLKLYIDKSYSEIAGKKDTGRGHIDVDAIQKAKEFLRLKHPQPVRIVDLAKYTKKSQARAARLLDLLSGVENGGGNENQQNIDRDFLVFCNDTDQPKTYGIFLDRQTGIYAYN